MHTPSQLKTTWVWPFDLRVSTCWALIVCLPSFMLIAQAMFLWQCGNTDTHTHSETQLITVPIPQLPLVWVLSDDIDIQGIIPSR